MTAMPKRFEELLEPITDTLRKSPPGYGLKVHMEFLNQLMDAYLDGRVEENRVGLRAALLDFLSSHLNCRWRLHEDGVGILLWRPGSPRTV